MLFLMSFGWESVLYLVIGLVAGGAAGFFGARTYFSRQLKKNPPINERQIRAMYNQMGMKPSEAKIKQIMKAMNDAR